MSFALRSRIQRPSLNLLYYNIIHKYVVLCHNTAILRINANTILHQMLTPPHFFTQCGQVHAEQFLVANMMQHGEQRLETLAISAAPCGHCRQFFSELCCAVRLTTVDLGLLIGLLIVLRGVVSVCFKIPVATMPEHSTILVTRVQSLWSAFTLLSWKVSILA
jgi:hypothetical protein